MATRATIKDVAAMAGYSIATVSMVLNKKEVSIPQTTRKKVWEAARQLNYRPNKLAISLLTKRTMVLGLIIPDNTSLLFASMSRAIEEEAHKAGYGLIYGNSGNEVKRDLEYLEMLADRQVDGIIMLISAFRDKEQAKNVVKAIHSFSIPVVAMDRAVPDSNIHTVQLNHFRSGYFAAKHLLELGHRRIACCASPGYLTARIERMNGYRVAMEEFGVPYDPTLYYEVSYDKGITAEIFRHLMSLDITAILSVNDSMALDAYRQAYAAGVRIPEDLSIVGSDDVVFADMIAPPLTTVRQPIAEIARTALHTLLDLVENGKNTKLPVMQLFEPELIVRGSTCPPRQK